MGEETTDLCGQWLIMIQKAHSHPSTVVVALDSVFNFTFFIQSTWPVWDAPLWDQRATHTTQTGTPLAMICSRKSRGPQLLTPSTLPHPLPPIENVVDPPQTHRGQESWSLHDCSLTSTTQGQAGTHILSATCGFQCVCWA